MVPASFETPSEDTELDLDVRPQPVARHVSDDDAAWLPNRAPCSRSRPSHRRRR
jgi:hypothetical protein